MNGLTKVVQIGRFGSEEKREAEKSMVQLVGGKVYQDQAGQHWAHLPENTVVAPGAKIYPAAEVPTGWIEE